MLFQISGKDCTFGNIITQCVYLWNLSPEGVYALHLPSSRAVFANDSAIIPFLASCVSDKVIEPDCVDLVLDNFAELPCSDTQLNPLETDSARNAFDVQHYGSTGIKVPPVEEFPSRLKSCIKVADQWKAEIDQQAATLSPRAFYAEPGRKKKKAVCPEPTSMKPRQEASGLSEFDFNEAEILAGSHVPQDRQKT